MAVDKRIVRIEFEGADRLTPAAKSAQDSVKDLRDALESVKNVLAAVGVTVGVGALLNLAHDTLKATASLSDLAQTAGTTVERLSAIQNVARAGGRDFEGFVGQLGLMIKGLKDANDDGQRASYALAQLGIKAKDLTGHFRDPVAIIEDLAAKLAVYGNSGNKAALIQDALGKGADRYLPLLKDIADKTDYHAKVTTAQAQAAEEAEKNINRLKLQFTDARVELVNKLTPAIGDFTEKLLLARQASGGLASGALIAGLNAGDLGDIDKRLAALNASLELIQKHREQNLQGSGWRGVLDLGGFARDAVSGMNEDLVRSEREFLLQLQKRRQAAAANDPNSPLFEFGGGGVTPELAYQSPDQRRLKPEQIAQMQAAGYEELKRQATEYTQYLSAEEIKRRDVRLKAIQEMVDQESMVQRAAVYGTTDESPENQHPGMAARTERLQLIREQLKTEEQIENEHHNTNMALLASFNDEELAALGGFQTAKERMEDDHQRRLADIRAAARSRDYGATADFFSNLASLTTSGNRALFEIGKASAIAETIIHTYAAAQKAFDDGARISYWVGVAYASAATVAGLVRVAAIASTSIGGKGTGAAPVFQANPTTSTPAASAAASAPAKPSTNVYINLVGRSADREGLKELFDQMNEYIKDGGRLILQS